MQMLLYFSVSNFRSIRSEITLSMSAGRFKNATVSRAFETGFAQIPCVLRASAIYGANASGKSSFVKALDFFQDFVIDSFREESGGTLQRILPYKYDSDLKQKPSDFEIAFVADAVMYTYGFSADREKVHDEWLHVKTKEGRVREVFSRSFVGESYEWHFSPFFKSRKMTNTWQESTRPNALFLSTAIQLNSEELKSAHSWITHTLKIITNTSLGNNVTSGSILEDEGADKSIVRFLKSADPTISNVNVKAKAFEDSEVFSVFSEEFRRSLVESHKDMPSYDVSITHINGEGNESTIELEEESDGTKSMYRYAWPFIQSTKNDFVVVVDELERSLHPLLLQYIVDRFISPEDESCNAQLVFTTHDTALLSADLLSPDQIWFIENVSGNGSELIPLADYKPRRGEAIQRAYLSGRYGGIPQSRERLLSNAE